MPHQEWLEQRKKSIGGSDAASIIGLNPWSSPYSVWADKLGKIPPKEDNEAMRLGRDLEDYVAKRFTEATGKKLRRENNILINPEYPFAHANVDRMVTGEDAGFEAKTTSALNLKKFKNGEFPDNYYAQCTHYLAVTGCKRWYLGVLILGIGFEWFVLERDEDEIAALMNAEKNFWECVKERIMANTDIQKLELPLMAEIMCFKLVVLQQVVEKFGCGLFVEQQILSIQNHVLCMIFLQRLGWLKSVITTLILLTNFYKTSYSLAS
jgi:putative phage-type endonuclease